MSIVKGETCTFFETDLKPVQAEFAIINKTGELETQSLVCLLSIWILGNLSALTY